MNKASNNKVQAAIETISAEKGVVFNSVSTKPANMNDKIMPQRIALWDRYGGSMSSGWVRWIFEKYNFEIFRIEKSCKTSVLDEKRKHYLEFNTDSVKKYKFIYVTRELESDSLIVEFTNNHKPVK